MRSMVCLLATFLGLASYAQAPMTVGAFPSPEEIRALPSREVPDAMLERRFLDPASWELGGPFPDRIETKPFADSSPAGAFLAAQAEKRGPSLIPTEAMHCVARELGRFLLTHGAQPSSAVRRFVAARCRSSAADTSLAYLGFQVPENEPHEVILRERAVNIRGLLANELGDAHPRSAGVWFGRIGERVVFAVAHGRRRVRVAPISGERLPGESVRIEGEVLEGVVSTAALINRGASGFASCAADPSVALPRFSFRCSTEGEREPAVISLQFRPAGRLLAEKGLDLLIFAKGNASATYRRPPPPAPATPATPEAVSEQALASVNALRARAGLDALHLSPAQSATADRLIAHFLHGAAGVASATLETATLGMLAGWDVEDPVRSGDVFWDWQSDSLDINRLLGHMVAYPEGRAVLLHADADTLAIGSTIDRRDDRSVLALLLAAYDTFGKSDSAATGQAILSALAAARASRRRAAPTELPEISALCGEAAENIASGSDPEQVLNGLLRRSAETTLGTVGGWLTETNRLDNIEFPDTLLEPADLSVGIGVAMHRAAGEPWGRYLVSIISVGEADAAPSARQN